VRGSMFDLWPLFLLRDKEKRKEMTGTRTQHVETLNQQFLQHITIKMVDFFSFFYQTIIKVNSCSLHLLFGSYIYRQQVTTFSTLAGVGIESAVKCTYSSKISSAGFLSYIGKMTRKSKIIN
jgi:hypothetical protein